MPQCSQTRSWPVILGIVGILAAVLLPAIRQAREAARRSSCLNNMRQIGLALHNYHSALGVLPPGVLGTSGSTSHNHLLHTWQALLLNHVEQINVYEAYDTDYRDDCRGRVIV